MGWRNKGRRSWGHGLHDRVFRLLGAIPGLSCSPGTKLAALVMLDKLSPLLSKVPRTEEAAVMEAVAALELATKQADPGPAVLYAVSLGTNLLARLNEPQGLDF